VLQVQYSAGSCGDYNVGGAQFYAMWNASGSAFQRMLVMYEAAFDAGLIRISVSGTFRSMESTRQGERTHWREIVEYVALRSVVEYDGSRNHHYKARDE
jgi:hypothetical protein